MRFAMTLLSRWFALLRAFCTAPVSILRPALPLVLSLALVLPGMPNGTQAQPTLVNDQFSSAIQALTNSPGDVVRYAHGGTTELCFVSPSKLDGIGELHCYDGSTVRQVAELNPNGGGSIDDLRSCTRVVPDVQ